jgi:hypothetical protein
LTTIVVAEKSRQTFIIIILALKTLSWTYFHLKLTK